MVVIRSARLSGNFTIIPNSTIRDKRLSLNAKGLHHLMLSFPQDYEFSIAKLIKLTGVKKTGISNYLKELQKNGYLVQVKKRRKNGTYGYDRLVLDVPFSPDSPPPENLGVDITELWETIYRSQKLRSAGDGSAGSGSAGSGSAGSGKPEGIKNNIYIKNIDPENNKRDQILSLSVSQNLSQENLESENIHENSDPEVNKKSDRNMVDENENRSSGYKFEQEEAAAEFSTQPSLEAGDTTHKLNSGEIS